VRGRVRFVLSPMALVDLLSILPLLIPALGIDLRSARVLRLFRVVRVAKLARYSRTLRLFGHVFRERAPELVVVLALLATLLLLTSSLMYYAENAAQPDVFSSIPATLWWAIATLTTVGYGDVYPVTGLGKLLAGVICVLGIGMFALPTSILGAAFSRQLEEAPRRCPHCGEVTGGGASS
jgi:voltage-gated potassium channel